MSSSDSENSDYVGSQCSSSSGDEVQIEELGLQPYQFEPEYSSDEEIAINGQLGEQPQNQNDEIQMVNRLANSDW